MAVDGVKFTQTVTELQSINAAHNLAPVDLLKPFTDLGAAAASVATGVLLKKNGSDFEPWIQGTDAANLIAGVFSGPSALVTDTDQLGLVRVFGPVQKDKLAAWTAADGSTTATPTTAALDQLETLFVFPL